MSVCVVELGLLCVSGVHPPFPWAWEVGGRQGLSAAGSAEKEAAGKAGAGEFPVGWRGRKGLHTDPSRES